MSLVQSSKRDAVSIFSLIFPSLFFLIDVSQGSRSGRITDEELSKLHGGSGGHLPPIMGHLGEGSYDLILGPRLKKEALPAGICEGKWRNHSAFFHFPWELTNTYHCFNDNSLAVLTSAFLQAILNPNTNTLTRNVYLFRDVLGHSSRSSLFYRLMYSMFGSSQVKPASDILTGGPHCVNHAVFGPPFKVYQKSSLFILRMKMYQLMKLVGKRIVNKPHRIGYDVSRRGEVSGNRQRPKESKRPRVVILTRNMTAPIHSANRKISTRTEQQLMRVFAEYGADVFICCDFRVINTVEKMIEVFWDVDICVSIHGAQISNCIFGSPGLVVFEFGSWHGYGVDVYMKLAYMMMGNYIFYDLRNPEKKTDMPGPGAVLSLPILHDVVQLCLATWRYTVNVTLPRVEKKLHLISSSTEHKTLYREANKHHGYTAPPATSLLPQNMYPNNAMKVYHQLSSSEAIVRFDRAEVFVNRSRYQEEYDVFLKQYLTYDKNEGVERAGRGRKAVNWDMREHKEHQLYKDIEIIHQTLDGNPDLLNFHKQRGRKANFMKVEGVEPYSLPANHREYMIYFHPFAFDSDDGSGSKGHRKVCLVSLF